MNIYSVYTDSNKKETPPLLIKQEFSMVAGIFNIIWALYNKMWIIASICLAFALFFSLFHSSSIAYAVNIITFLFFGCFASEIQEYYAQKKYKLEISDIILANDLEEAELKYYIRRSNNN